MATLIKNGNDYVYGLYEGDSIDFQTVDKFQAGLDGAGNGGIFNLTVQEGFVLAVEGDKIIAKPVAPPADASECQEPEAPEPTPSGQTGFGGTTATPNQVPEGTVTIGEIQERDEQ